MEKNNSKIIAVAALVVAVIGLSIGFAAFTATLTIENTSATMAATDQFSQYVNYRSSVSPTCYVVNGGSSASVSGSYSAGTVSGKQWSGVRVPLSMESGAVQTSVTCQATIENLSAYRAALNEISVNGSIACESSTSVGTSGYATNASTICAGMEVTIELGNASKTFSNSNLTALTGISNVGIASQGTETVTMTIAYTGTVAADGDVSITIPTVSLDFVSAAAQ